MNINSSKMKSLLTVVRQSVHHRGSKGACSPLLTGLPSRLIAMRMMIMKMMGLRMMKTMLGISQLTLLIEGGALNLKKKSMRKLNKMRTPNLSSQLSSRISSKMLAKSNATNLL